MKVILHIGTEKTGSTSIQRTLAEDREELAERGILYPRLFGSDNHMEIAVAAMDLSRDDELKIVELGRQNCDHLEYRRRLRDKLRSELAGGSFHTLVISNEHCHSRLLSDEAVMRLRDLIAGIGSVDRFSVIVYLRRQDRLAVSLESTRVRLGGSGPLFPGGDNGRMPDYFCFDRLLDRYARVFGAENLIVRLYERDRLHKSSVVADLYRETGLGEPAADVGELNTSLPLAQYLFLKRFNRTFPTIRDGKINPERGPIQRAIRDVCPGPPFRPARGAAQAFHAHFLDSNAHVQRTYLPHLDRPTLFDGSFDEYPETEEVQDLTPEQLFDFVTAIWRHKR